jgi:glycosyltransferase involved in cell wall biosynthesis
MKILHLGKFYPPENGGIETVTYELVQGFNKHGIVCDVLACTHRDQTHIQMREAGTNSYRVYLCRSSMRIGSFSFSADYIKRCREVCKNYDVLVLHMPNPLGCLALLLSGFIGKVQIIWHSDVIRQTQLLFFYQPLQSWAIRRADIIYGATLAHIQESDCTSEFLGKFEIIPFGISDLSANVRTHIESRVINVLAIGRLVYYKGFDVLIKAVSMLPDYYRLAIIGIGPAQGKLEALIDNLNLRGRVTLLGSVDSQNLQQSLLACDIFCLPSTERSEMYGMVQLEAMAYGKPLIVTDIPRSGTRYVNRHGVTGYTVAVNDVTELFQSIFALGESSEDREKFGRAARDLYLSEYTSSIMVQRYIKSTNKLLI